MTDERSPRRLLGWLVGLALVGVAVALLATIATRQRSEQAPLAGTRCVPHDDLVLQAQSVPGATRVPCLADDLETWRFDSERYGNAGSTVVLRAGDGGLASWTLQLTATCTPPADAAPAPALGGAARQARRSTRDGAVVQESWVRFDGGCLTSTVQLPDQFDTQLVLDQVDASLILVDRAAVSGYVRSRTDGRLGLDPPP